MTDTTAKVRAKGCDSTGITEAIASTLYANKGQRIMAIVELHAVERHEKADGGRRVDLTIELLEPTTDDAMAEHLRELTRTLYRNRALAEGQLAIDDTLTPSIGDAIAAGQQHRPHPFLPADASLDFPICDVCGGLEHAGVHAAQTDGVRDPFAVPDPDEGPPELADPDDPDTHETLPIMGDDTTTEEAEPVPTT